MSRPCPLCAATDTRVLVEVEGQRYWRCETCLVTFLDPSCWLSAAAERAVYEHHENEVHDAGYRRFLSKLADPVLACLAPGSRGLDYGCGPGPALAAMLSEAGHTVALYDPFFAPDGAVLAETYDFVVCTETAEHFHDAGAQFATLDRILRPGGVLGVMTCFQTDDARFAGWHYRNDPTHVVFYREQSFRWLARRLGWRIEVPCKDVVLFHKPPI